MKTDRSGNTATIARDQASDSDLPEGWTSALLPDACAINPPKPSTHALAADAPVTFVPMPAVDAEAGAITKPETRPFSKVRNGFTAFQEGDVILAKITPCMENGKAAIGRNLLNGLGFGSTEFHVLRSKGALLSEFIYYFVRQESFRRAAEAEMTGSVGQRRVPVDFLNQVELPIPPLAEQKRIAARIEGLLTQVDGTRARLIKVRLILKRFRQAILAAAYSGRLTADWRESHPHAEDGRRFVERIMVEREQENQRSTRAKSTGYSSEPPDGKELPDTWTWSPFGLVTKNFDGRRVPVKADDRAKRAGRYPYYGASGIIDTIDDYLFNGDYLLIGEDGANLVYRSTPIAFRVSGKFWVNNHAHVVQTFAGIPLAYLEVCINGIDLQEFVTGSAQPKLTQDALNRIPLPIPPLEEQHEIVRRVEVLFKLAHAIEKRICAATKRAEKLTQAILAKAFRGELVPTEAVLARHEGRGYEPASVLLERVRTQRERSTQEAGRARAQRRRTIRRW
jgi:type I restriction enzyme, S subunit